MADEVDKVREGKKITLTAGFRDFRNYMYSWQQEELGIDIRASSTPTLTIRIPEGFIKDSDTTMQRITFVLNADDGSSSFRTTKILPVIKVNNGNPRFMPMVTSSEISIAVDDPDGNGNAIYTWEQRSINNAGWDKISDAIMPTYMPAQATGDMRYRVQVSHTDTQGYISTTATLGPFRTDIDDDDNGLIDIYYLEDLNNVRYQSDGSGYTTEDAAKITLGCPTEGCDGYELRRDLDFATTQSYINAETNKATWTVDDFNDRL